MRTAVRFPSCPRIAVLLLLLVASSILPGCALYHYQAPIQSTPSPTGLSPIGRALDYLDQTQVKSVVRPLAGGGDFPGNWPQYMLAEGPVDIRVRDVSPFIPALMHHSLSLIHEENQAALGLDGQQIDRARAMRRSAVEFMQRFATEPGSPTAGSYGFWPRMDEFARLQRPVLGFLRGDWLAKPTVRLFMGGPTFSGPLHCLNLRQMPSDYGIYPDLDTTSVIYAALQDAHRFDGATRTHPPFRLFQDWRDTGRTHLRVQQDWLPETSGAFLTYFNPTNNDVDLVVNANILHMLARHGQLECKGAREAQQLIAKALDRDLADTTAWDNFNLNYLNPMMGYYCISRAYSEGPVSGLEPAMANITDAIRRLVRINEDGSVYWDFGQPALDTAFGILVLLHADAYPELIPGAIQTLLDQQDPRRGCWAEGSTSGGTSPKGRTVDWLSAPYSTAVALEALCRFRLEAENRPDPRWRDLAAKVVSQN